MKIIIIIIIIRKKIYENIFLGYFPIADMKKKWMNVFWYLPVFWNK